MCWKCDNPTGNYLDHLEAVIAECGWAVQVVEGDRVHPPWAYTVGLTPRGAPELVVTGMRVELAQRLLNDMADHVLHSGDLVHGDRIPLCSGMLIEVVRLPEPAAHLFVAADLYAPALRASQLVHADDRGQWPWDRGYRGGHGGQPVLGPRAESRREHGRGPDPG